MFYVYILESAKNNELYIGFANDLKKRVEKHNNKYNYSTKNGAPWHAIYYEACLNKDDAIRREQYLKTSQGRRLAKARLKEYFYNKKIIQISTAGC